MKTEPFAELTRKRFEKWFEKSGYAMRACAESAYLAGMQAALPTQEQYAQAAREIAEYMTWKQTGVKRISPVLSPEEVEQVLTSILGQPGGKQ